MTTLLDRILDFDNVQTAWEHTRKAGQTPGVDDWSARRFARRWEENLRGLIADVRANQYQPKRLRVRYVPKRGAGRASGGERVASSDPATPQPRTFAHSQALRRLGIPTLRDRILQRAALHVLSWRFERKFLACSYGYRPKRSLFHAVAAVLGYRDRGLRWVLSADIDNCFDSLDHGVLWTLVQQEIDEPPVLRLLEQWLEVGMVDRRNRKGVSQGMPIAPLLCNVYLHELDWRMLRARRPLVRYADDFIALGRSRDEIVDTWGLVEGYLELIKLHLEPSKTGITHFDEGFQFLGVRFEDNRYAYTWEGREIEVRGQMGPLWSMWDYFPHGYDG